MTDARPKGCLSTTRGRLFAPVILSVAKDLIARSCSARVASGDGVPHFVQDDRRIRGLSADKKPDSLCAPPLRRKIRLAKAGMDRHLVAVQGVISK